MSDSKRGSTGKPRELQGFLNRHLYHPLARRLAMLLVPTPVTPNMVSVAGAAMVMIAGVLYTLVGTPAAVAAGFAIHLAWHVVDGADGDLARLSGRASPSGEIVDGVCDYAGHAVLYCLLGWSLSQTMGAGAGAWALTIAAGLSRVVQSSFAENQRRCYQWWAYGTPWIQVARDPGGQGAGGGFALFYLSIWRRMTPETQRANALVAGAQADPAERAGIARIARRLGAHGLIPLQLLGANARTVMLGVSMIAGAPEAYLATEIVLLNALLAAAIVQQQWIARRMMDLVRRDRR